MSSAAERAYNSRGFFACGMLFLYDKSTITCQKSPANVFFFVAQNDKFPGIFSVVGLS